MVECHSTAKQPGRPSKFAFGERVSQKFKPQIRKRKRSMSAPRAVTPDVDQPEDVTPGPSAQDSFLPNHVRTCRMASQPVKRVLLKARPDTRQNDPVQPGPSVSILSLAFPEPYIDYPTTTHASPQDSGLAEQRHETPRLHRKEPPQLTVRDALAERFVKLRLPATTHTPPAPSEVPASRGTTNFSFPFQHSNSTKAAKSAWNRMASSNPFSPNSRGQLYSDTNRMNARHRRRGENSMDPIFMGGERGDQLSFDPNSSVRDDRYTQAFHSTGLSRQLMNRRRTRPDRLDQSPREPYIGCRGFLTPNGIIVPSDSDDSGSGLSPFASDRESTAIHVRNAIPVLGAQEDRDSQLARGLQEGRYLPTSSQLAVSDSILPHHYRYHSQRIVHDAYMAQQPGMSLLTERYVLEGAQAKSSETVRLNSLRQAINHIGTREDSVNMNSAADEGTHLRHRSCLVCDNNVAVGDLPSLSKCEHRPETCADCYSNWITAQLQGSSWREAKCPVNDCNVVLSYNDIQQYADSETFQKYDTFKTRALISEDPNFRWCQAPGCSSGQIHTSGTAGNIFTCSACGTKACVIHGNTWHEGETCAEFDYRSSGRKQRDQRAQEEATLKAIKELTKRCPGPGCNWNIQKSHGCDHMTCAKCGYEFCWICLCDYKRILRYGNEIHARTCAYHPSNLPYS